MIPIKKIIIRSLFISLSYLGLVLLWSITVPSKFLGNITIPTSGFQKQRLDDLDKFNNIDILFIGSSHSYRGFDPRIFQKEGYSTYNLGSSAQTPIQSHFLLERYIEHLSPELVVFEVYPKVFELDGIESSADIIANSPLDRQIMELGLKQRSIHIFNTLVFKIWETLLGLSPREISYHNDNYVTGGFVERDKSSYKPRGIELGDFDFIPPQMEAFRSITALLEQKEIKLILVYAPITKKLYESSSLLNFEELMDSTYGSYVNFNGQLTLIDSIDFYDENHLSQAGVIKFNSAFIRFLKRKLE